MSLTDENIIERLAKQATKYDGQFLPCPFCGEKERIGISITNTDLFWVECLNCHANGGSDSDMGECVKAWNRREGQEAWWTKVGWKEPKKK